MNQKNYEYLKDQVKYSGFGNTLDNFLKEAIESKAPLFHATYEPKIGTENVLTTLHFRKSEKNDMYFFNKYDLELKSANNGENVKQTFYISKDNNITLKEAYNLLHGRAVDKNLTNKDGQTYKAWLQLDFKKVEPNGNYKMNYYHENYGYDINKEMTKFPIKELNDSQDATLLLHSLQKGNLQSITMINNSKEVKMFIEANPQFKTINVYDHTMAKMEKEAITRLQLTQKDFSTDGLGARQSTTREVKERGTGTADDDVSSAFKNSQKSKRKGHSH